jgi:excisionase family DNA binding protein
LFGVVLPIPITSEASMSKFELPEDPTVSVPEAGRLLGVGRSCAYEAAERGEIPVIRIGRLKRVPKLVLKAMLETGVRPPASAAL